MATLFDYLTDEYIEVFTYRGKRYSYSELLSFDDVWLNLAIDIVLSNGNINALTYR